MCQTQYQATQIILVVAVRFDLDNQCMVVMALIITFLFNPDLKVLSEPLSSDELVFLAIMTGLLNSWSFTISLNTYSIV